MTKTSVQNISDPPKPENVGDTLPLTTQPKTIQKNDKLSLKDAPGDPLYKFYYDAAVKSGRLEEISQILEDNSNWELKLERYWQLVVEDTRTLAPGQKYTNTQSHMTGISVRAPKVLVMSSAI